MTNFEGFFVQLAREPDFDAPELRAYDATDELLLRTVLSDFAVLAKQPGAVVVIGDRHGALTLGAVALCGASGIRVYQDPLLAERALAANAARLKLEGSYSNRPLDESLLSGAKLVLLQLPRSLAELDEIAYAIARWADPDVVVLAGGRDKHMSRSMNDELLRSFERVSAGLGWRKSRVLTAQGPRSQQELGEPRFAVWGEDHDLRFSLSSFGATFGGAALDHGTRLLLRTLRDEPPPVSQGEPSLRIVDLGCGNGVLAVSAALLWPEAKIIATDQSAAAVAATRLTSEAAGVADRVEVQRADATEAVPDAWADLILLNPPFHTGSTVHAGVAHRLIGSCARALRGSDDAASAGGELRLVFNTQLAYRSLVERVIGPTRQLARDRTFTVLSAHLR